MIYFWINLNFNLKVFILVQICNGKVSFLRLFKFSNILQRRGNDLQSQYFIKKQWGDFALQNPPTEKDSLIIIIEQLRIFCLLRPN